MASLLKRKNEKDRKKRLLLARPREIVRKTSFLGQKKKAINLRSTPQREKIDNFKWGKKIGLQEAKGIEGPKI